MSNIEKTLDVCIEAHRGQYDKSGVVYAFHPIKVSLKMFTDEEKMVALLHDVVEDTPLKLHDLRTMGFSEVVINGVDAMSRRDGETVKEYYKRIMANEIATKVKIADLEHNMDPTRLLVVKKKDKDRLGMYHDCWKKLRQLVHDREGK